MQQSRTEFLKEILDFIGQADDTGACDTMERILNVALQTLWGKRAWRAFVYPSPYELTTAASTRRYALPDWFGRVSGNEGVLRNLTTGRRILPTTRSLIETYRPAAGTSLDTVTQEPTHYFFAGTWPVHTQPSTSGAALEVLSDAAGDVEILVSLAGVKSGQWTREEVTLAGATPVAIGTWSELHEFGKSYPAGSTPATELTSSRGTVTLRTVAGSAALQTLLPAESSRIVQVLELDPTPDATYTIGIPFVRAVQKVWRSADPLPFGWGPALREECLIQWQVNAGLLSLDAAAKTARPALYDLVCDENAFQSQQQRQKLPYTGR